jgi:hypothetical protein
MITPGYLKVKKKVLLASGMSILSDGSRDGLDVISQ